MYTWGSPSGVGVGNAAGVRVEVGVVVGSGVSVGGGVGVGVCAGVVVGTTVVGALVGVSIGVPWIGLAGGLGAGVAHPANSAASMIVAATSLLDKKRGRRFSGRIVMRFGSTVVYRARFTLECNILPKQGGAEHVLDAIIQKRDLITEFPIWVVPVFNQVADWPALLHVAVGGGQVTKMKSNIRYERQVGVLHPGKSQRIFCTCDIDIGRKE